MKLPIEQIFYGRGEYGYDVLGASPGGRTFSSRIESLCGAVGTPGHDYSGEPFLISVPEGDRIIMICGRKGAPDSMGRSTLFFHALVVEKKGLSDANADAFSLFSQGVFVDKMPGGEIVTMCIDVKPLGKGNRDSGDFSEVALPCLIRSKTPALNFVRSVVGDKSLELSWATFSFRTIPSFDVQVLSPDVPCSQNVNKYDDTGTLIRAAVANHMAVRAKTARSRQDESANTSRENIMVVASPPKDGVLLKVSIFANIVLAVVCAVLFVSRDSAKYPSAMPLSQVVVTNTVDKIVERPVPAQVSDSQKIAIEEEAVKRERSMMSDKFPSQSREAFLKFDKMASELFAKYYGKSYEEGSEENKENFKQEHDFLVGLATGIDFINNSLLKGKTQ